MAKKDLSVQERLWLMCNTKLMCVQKLHYATIKTIQQELQAQACSHFVHKQKKLKECLSHRYLHNSYTKNSGFYSRFCPYSKQEVNKSGTSISFILNPLQNDRKQKCVPVCNPLSEKNQSVIQSRKLKWNTNCVTSPEDPSCCGSLCHLQGLARLLSELRHLGQLWSGLCVCMCVFVYLRQIGHFFFFCWPAFNQLLSAAYYTVDGLASLPSCLAGCCCSPPHQPVSVIYAQQPRLPGAGFLSY